ncbi:DUF4249 domain-containing protein [bacterium]|nr:DUF4249 domain-containing protein [bacterium]
MRIRIIISVLYALAAASCISQFTPEIVTQDRFLTVIGLITDENRRYEIKLTYSKPLDETSAEEPARGAIVSVLDDMGHSWAFTEVKPGVYRSDSTQFRGTPGHTYTLRIQHKGNEYQSAPCLLRAAPPIDTLTHEIIDREINASGDVEQFVRVALSSFDPASETHYFRWTFEETWELHLPFNQLTYYTAVCWTSDKSHGILIANTEALAEDRITDFTLTEFDNSSDRGQYKYSMLVHQHSVSPEEYEFWDNVKKVSENTGGLYDVIPAAVPGNVNSTSDPSDLVLGYFSVSGVTSKRIFIRSPLVVPDLYHDKCVEDVIPRNPGLIGLGTEVWVLNEFENEFGGVFWEITRNKSCTNCALFASNVKPDYWDEGFRQYK